MKLGAGCAGFIWPNIALNRNATIWHFVTIKLSWAAPG
jgi:hypothetical protein